MRLWLPRCSPRRFEQPLPVSRATDVSFTMATLTRAIPSPARLACRPPGNQEKGAIANGRAMGERIAKLEAFKERFAFIGDVRGIGLLQGMEFVQDRETKKPFGPEVPIVKMIDQAARKRGLIMRCGPDYIALAPPLIITSSEVDEMLDILEDSLVEVGGRL